MLGRVGGALAVVVTVLTTVLATLLGAPTGTAAAAARPTLAISPGAPIVGESVTVTTRLPHRVARPVVLQRLSGARWVTLARSTSASSGQVTTRFRLRASSVTLRVLASTYRVRGRTYAAVVSSALRVAAQPQRVALTTSRDAADRVDVTIVASHLRRGRSVEVLAQSAGTWRSVARTTMTTSRTMRIPDAVTVAAVRGQRLRARLAPLAGAPAVTSTIQSPPALLSVDAVVDGTQVRVDALTAGTVRAVRFYADGELLSEDRAAPWSTTWAPRIGRHDVVVRVLGPLESVLSEAVDVRTSAAPVGADTGVAEGFALESVQSGLELPTSAATLPTGAVLVTEKAGLVKVVEPAGESGWSPPRTVLDLRAEVHDGGDAGLIGIAVAPDFLSSGHVHLSYVRDDGEGERRSQQVARYTWDGAALDPQSRHVVLGAVTGLACSAEGNLRTPGCIPLLGESHTIGDLAFDDEGRLLVGVGDGALYLTGNGLAGRLETLRAQDLEVLAGKVLRIDPDSGRGVPDNPSYDGDGTSNASRVLASGLRNPFRFAVHDGLLVIGDVGEGSVEEIDLLEAAEGPREVPNFGWPCREGDADTALGDVGAPDSPWHACVGVREEARGPAYSYPHGAGGGSVSGGVFLDAEAYPPAVRGRYVFGDYAQNFIRTADISHHAEVSGVAPLADATAAEGPVKFFTGPDGLVWSVSIMTGSLRRIRWTGTTLADQCPTGTFRRTFHDLDGPDSPFDEEIPPGDYSWLLPYAGVQLPSAAVADATCEAGIALSTTGTPWASEEEPDTREHPGDRFGTAWRGRIDVAAGTYRFTVAGSEWVRLWVDDALVHDFYSNGFWSLESRQHEVVLEPGQHVVRAELVHGDEDLAAAEVTWEQVGGPPSIQLLAPVNGHLATTGEVPWEVAVSDPDGDDLTALQERVEVEVDFLHYSGDGFHAHPSSRVTGTLSGTLAVSDLHAPGSGVVRLRANVTDASGARSRSAPVYICFPGGEVGPCASS